MSNNEAKSSGTFGFCCIPAKLCCCCCCCQSNTTKNNELEDKDRSKSGRKTKGAKVEKEKGQDQIEAGTKRAIVDQPTSDSGLTEASLVAELDTEPDSIQEIDLIKQKGFQDPTKEVELELFLLEREKQRQEKLKFEAERQREIEEIIKREREERFKQFLRARQEERLRKQRLEEERRLREQREREEEERRRKRALELEENNNRQNEEKLPDFVVSVVGEGRLPRYALARHVWPAHRGPLTREAAADVSAARFDAARVFANTVFQDPSAWLFCRITSGSLRVISVRRVETMHCVKACGMAWRVYPRKRCFAIFLKNGHLMYRESYKTEEKDDVTDILSRLKLNWR